MYEETEYTAYDGAEKVPDEIRNIRVTVVGKFTLRETLFFTGAMMTAGIIGFILFSLLKLHGREFILFPALGAAPFLAFGFFHPGGLNLEDYLVIWWSNNIKSAPIRRLSSINTYESVQMLAVKRRENKENPKKVKKNKHNSFVTVIDTDANNDSPDSANNVVNVPKESSKTMKNKKKQKSAYTIRL